MVRQCAWCLYLINCSGERLSASPLPKLYEASHGICGVCGVMWIARAIDNHAGQGSASQPEYKEPRVVGQPEYKGQRVSRKVTAPTFCHPTDS
jgi:hypothetical protein